MTSTLFFRLAAIGSFFYGGILFFLAATGAALLGIDPAPASLALLHGLGGLIIGSATMNWLAGTMRDMSARRAVLIVNLVTHFFGLAADAWGIAARTLSVLKMAPVELTHLFIAIGSCIYLLKGNRPK
jgi:xanthosine utilization system XapX-like protein